MHKRERANRTPSAVWTGLNIDSCRSKKGDYYAVTVMVYEDSDDEIIIGESARPRWAFFMFSLVLHPKLRVACGYGLIKRLTCS